MAKYQLIDITPKFAAQGVLDTMDEAMIAIDAEGIIRLINRAATAMFGRPEKELLGRPFTMIFGEGAQPVLDGSASSGAYKLLRIILCAYLTMPRKFSACLHRR